MDAIMKLRNKRYNHSYYIRVLEPKRKKEQYQKRLLKFKKDYNSDIDLNHQDLNHPKK